MFVPGSCLSGDVKELSISNFNFEEEGSYTGINAYRNSKAAVIMFGYTLAQKLQGTGVTVNSLCPGEQIVCSAPSSMCTYIPVSTWRYNFLINTTDIH